jgi:uncharacterized protein (TIGR02001 family)
VGLISYNYPGKGASTKGVAGIGGVLDNPNTTEVYGAIGYKWVTVKYSQAISKNFIGWVPTNTASGTRGSNYLEINAAYDMGDGWGVSGHVGHQKVKNVAYVSGPPVYEDANYTDWNVGVTKDVGFGVVGLTYSTTNAKGTCTSAGGTSVYCWGKGMNTATASGFRDVADDTVVLSFKKTF